MSPDHDALLRELDAILTEAPEIAGDLGADLLELVCSNRNERRTERPGAKEAT